MDALGTIILLVLLALVVFVIAGFVGFKIPAPLSEPADQSTGEVAKGDLPADWPPAARRWLGDAPEPTTLVAWGRGSIASRLPLLGKIWLPLAWTLYLTPGTDFMIQYRITWFARNFIRGGEEYRDGKGTFILGSKPLDNPHLDQTERTMAWLYSLWLVPASLIRLPGLSFQSGANDGLRLIVTQPDQPVLTFDLAFDPHSGTLQTITTTRKGSRTGQDYPYLAHFTLPRAIAEIGTISTHFVGDWDQDVYLKLDLAGIKLNQDISETMQAGIHPV
jgi:hypothetical protein